MNTFDNLRSKSKDPQDIDRLDKLEMLFLESGIEPDIAENTELRDRLHSGSLGSFKMPVCYYDDSAKAHKLLASIDEIVEGDRALKRRFLISQGLLEE